MRFLTLTILAAGALCAGALPAAADAVAFRPNVTVDGDVVTVGDLFDGAGPAATQPVAQSPSPGRRVIFDARALASVAQAFALDWHSASPHDRTVIDRSALVIGHDRVATLIQDALLKQGITGSFTAVFDQTQNQLVLPKGAGELSLATLSYDPLQRRFSGMLTAASPDGPVTLPVSGVTADVVQIPVLSRPFKEGEIISARDLTLAAMRADRVARDTLAKPEDLIGHAAERPIQPGRALRRNDLRRDLLVKRNQAVVLVLDDGTMSLSVQARALTDGAKGEPAKAINPSSSRVIEGVVTGPGIITVYDNTPTVGGAPAPLALSDSSKGDTQ